MQGSRLPNYGRRYKRVNLTRRFYAISAITALVITCHIFMADSQSYTYKGETYDQRSKDNYDRGQIVEYTNSEEF
jgi:hypothetical protein